MSVFTPEQEARVREIVAEMARQAVARTAERQTRPIP